MRRIVKRGLRARLSDFISNRINEWRNNYVRIDEDFEDIDFGDMDINENSDSHSVETSEPKNKTTLKELLDKGYSIEQIRGIEDKLLLFNENYDDPRFQEELSKITPANIQGVNPSNETIDENPNTNKTTLKDLLDKGYSIEQIRDLEDKLKLYDQNYDDPTFQEELSKITPANLQDVGVEEEQEASPKAVVPKTPEEIQEAYYQACEEMINEVKKIQDDIANKERIIREDEANSKKFEEIYDRPDDIYRGRIEFTKNQIQELKIILANYLREEIDYYVDGKPYKKVTRKQAIDFYNNHLDTINRQKEYQEKEALKKEEAKIPDLEKELRDIEYNLTIGTYYRESPEKAKEMAARRDELYSKIKDIKEKTKKEDNTESEKASVKPKEEKIEEIKEETSTQSELSLDEIISKTEQIESKMRDIISRIKLLSEELGRLSQSVEKMKDPLDELREMRTKMDSIVTNERVLPETDAMKKSENAQNSKLEELKEMRRHIESLSNKNASATVSPIPGEEDSPAVVSRHI